MAARKNAPRVSPDELLQLVLEGRASAVERDRFEQELAASASLRESYRVMAALFQDLASLPAPAPPEDMKGAVLARLGSRRPPQRFTPRKLFLGLAWATAAAVLAVVALRHPDPAPLQASGTMAPQEASTWPMVDHLTAPAGSLTIRRKDRDYAFFLKGTGPGTASLRWNPNHWESLSTQGNPVLLRRLAETTEVGLQVDGLEVLTLPITGAR